MYIILHLLYLLLLRPRTQVALPDEQIPPNWSWWPQRRGCQRMARECHGLFLSLAVCHVQLTQLIEIIPEVETKAASSTPDSMPQDKHQLMPRQCSPNIVTAFRCKWAARQLSRHYKESVSVPLCLTQSKHGGTLCHHIPPKYESLISLLPFCCSAEECASLACKRTLVGHVHVLRTVNHYIRCRPRSSNNISRF